MKKPEAFTRVPDKVLEEDAQDTHGRDLIARSLNGIGWEINIHLIPDWYGQRLEFAQINHPDGTSSYFRKGNGDEVEAGPFGGGHSWAVPKYVVKEAHKMLNTAFPVNAEEPVPA